MRGIPAVQLRDARDKLRLELFSIHAGEADDLQFATAGLDKDALVIEQMDRLLDDAPGQLHAVVISDDAVGPQARRQAAQHALHVRERRQMVSLIVHKITGDEDEVEFRGAHFFDQLIMGRRPFFLEMEVGEVKDAKSFHSRRQIRNRHADRVPLPACGRAQLQPGTLCGTFVSRGNSWRLRHGAGHL